MERRDILIYKTKEKRQSYKELGGRRNWVLGRSSNSESKYFTNS